MGKSSGECLVKTCDTYIDIFAHFSRCKYKCLYKCLCTQNCVQFSHTHNTYYIISFSFWLYMENKHKQQKIKKMCTNYQSDWPWTETGYHFPLDVWWIYLGKWHNDRTLFSRTLEIMGIGFGKSSPNGPTIQVGEILFHLPRIYDTMISTVGWHTCDQFKTSLGRVVMIFSGVGRVPCFWKDSFDVLKWK